MERDGLLRTDQYQLAMAQLYLAERMHELEAEFEYFFRSYPDYGGHRAGFCVFAGLEPLIDWLETASALPEEVEAVRRQVTSSGVSRFSEEFVSWLGDGLDFGAVRLDAVGEGRVVHPNTPVLVATGPLAALQLLETPLLNRLNYPTLIATKAARVKLAAGDGTVLEFGLRRGPESGAASGTRAALIGGADFSSNVEVSHSLGLDPKGTHAHSMVQAFAASGGDELEAFRAFARLYPDECVLLVDTYDTLDSGLPHALTVFEELRRAGHTPRGVRLDSGDLAELAVAVRRRLDDAGFSEVGIVLSSDLDEMEISRILARIEQLSPGAGLAYQDVIASLTYGVGTRLITSHGASALGGVFKLGALRQPGGEWRASAKTSDSGVKATIAGRKRTWRVYGGDGRAAADVVGPATDGVPPFELPEAAGGESSVEALLDVVYERGARIGAVASLAEIRARRGADISWLPDAVVELVEPAPYPVVVSPALQAGSP